MPKIEKNPILQPQVAVNPNPKLVIQPAIDIQPVKLPDNPLLPNVGILNSKNNVVLSNGKARIAAVWAMAKTVAWVSAMATASDPGEGGNLGGGSATSATALPPPRWSIRLKLNFLTKPAAPSTRASSPSP